MDIEKLVELLQNNRHPNGLKAQAASALSTLQAENEKLRAELEYEKEHANAYYEECGQWEAENEKLRAEADGMRSNWYKAVEEIKKLRAELEQAKRERDAAVEDLQNHRKYKCDCCIYANSAQRFPCVDCQSPISNYGDAWKWRGPQKED